MQSQREHWQGLFSALARIHPGPAPRYWSPIRVRLAMDSCDALPGLGPAGRWYWLSRVNGACRWIPLSGPRSDWIAALESNPTNREARKPRSHGIRHGIKAPFGKVDQARLGPSSQLAKTGSMPVMNGPAG